MDKLVIPASAQIEVYSHVGPFDRGIAALDREGVGLWSGRDLAETRIRAGAQHPVSREWSWVSSAFLYDHGSDADILVVSGSYNPLLKNPGDATTAHRANSEFTDFNYASLRERAVADPTKALESGVLLLSRKNVREEIPSTSLADHALTAFLFEDQAALYGEFLSAAGIKNVPSRVVDKGYSIKQSNPFARALWVGDLGGRSDLDGSSRVLRSDDGRVRGVRRIEGPAGAGRAEARLETQVAAVPNVLSQTVEIGDGFARIGGRLYVPVPDKALESILAK